MIESRRGSSRAGARAAPLSTLTLQLSTGASQLLGNFLESVTLDDVTDFVVVEIAKLDAAFEAAADFFHVLVEATQRGETAIVNRRATARDTGPRRARQATVGD